MRKGGDFVSEELIFNGESATDSVETASDATVSVETDSVETDSVETDVKQEKKHKTTHKSILNFNKDEHHSSKTQGYVHVYCRSDDNVCEILERCGFSSHLYDENSSFVELHNSIKEAKISVIFEPSEDSDYNVLAYQIREAEVAKIETFIISAGKGSLGFTKKFEDTENITLIKSGNISEIFHLLIVEKLCKMPELFSEEKCTRNKYGDIARHGVDAYRGVAASERFIAEAYMSGEVLPKLNGQAVFWFTRAVGHGSIRSIVSLGDCYFYGIGCPVNKKRAYEMYCEAAKQNSPEGFFRKGICHFDGEGCEEDDSVAYSCFKKAIALKRDFPEAEYYLAVCLRDGRGTDASYIDAKTHFLKSAKGDYTPSLVELGNLFSENHGDDRNPARAFEYYSRAAANGSAVGLYKKGLALCTGDGCEKNESEAYKCFLSGASIEDLSCICSLGMCYEYGIGCECDYTKAVQRYTVASERGHAPATNNLGGCYYYGHGVKKDRKRALALFEKAANMGDSNAMTRLGLCYESGTDCEKDLEKAFLYFCSAAKQNNAIAAYKAGLCYESGRGTQTNLGRALPMFEMAATLGHIPSILRTASYLANGIGAEKDLKSAYKWYAKGAECDNAECCLQMAHFCFKGISTSKNYTKAFSLYNKAYELGLDREEMADTALRIGVCHLRGLGTQEDRALALEWFKKGAAGGSANAMFMCGESYYFGSGCEKNYESAVAYYIHASNAGHERSFLELARCYDEGLGVEKSRKLAKKYYKEAVLLGNPEAKYRLVRMACEDGKVTESARPMLFQAAREGYLPAYLLLGIMCEEGIGIAPNPDRALEMYFDMMKNAIEKQKTLLFSMPERQKEYSKAVEDASVEAAYRHGMIAGRRSKDINGYTNAFEHLAYAAAAGYRKAQEEIAKIYAWGGDLHTYFHTSEKMQEPSDAAIADSINKLGDSWYQGDHLLRKNDSAALRCYRIAAKLGQSDAAYSLGWCLRHGVGTKVDDVEAAKWLKKSADSGNPYAAYSYGLCCEEGSGMEHPNLREAATYYRIAAAAGHADAKKRHLKITGGK